MSSSAPADRESISDVAGDPQVRHRPDLTNLGYFNPEQALSILRRLQI